MADKKHCPTCGKELEADDKFCFGCGADVSKRSYSKDTDASERLTKVEGTVKKIADFLDDKFADDSDDPKNKRRKKTLFGD